MRKLIYIAKDGTVFDTLEEAKIAGCADNAKMIEEREVETPEQEAERLARISQRMIKMGKPELA